MISAIAQTDDGMRIILLGVTRENIHHLMNGQPIRVTAESHPGFPTDLKIMVVFGETEGVLTLMLQDVIDSTTKIIAVPRETPPAA